ncbi:MAG: hypothetical protein H8E66_04580 [Planctomycetes bacterium]|nr:hypothetical protein [Planctomycetota bacterium]
MSEFEQLDFTTDYLGDGVRYKLPARQLGRARHLGWAVVGVGLIMSLMMLAWMSGPVLGGIDDLKKDAGIGLFSIAFGCFGLIGLIPGLGLLFGGLAIVCNRTRCEVEIRGGRISVKERFFLARLKRKRKTSGIQQLRVVDSSEHISGDKEHQLRNTKVWMGDSATALMAITGGKGKFLIAAAYPREILVRLAEELAPRLEADVSVQSTTINRQPSQLTESESTARIIEVVEGPIEKDVLPTIPDQPADSTATIDRRPYGITIEIPPVGLWKGSKGLFFFAMIWNAFMSIFVVVGVLGAAGVIQVEGDGPPWMMLLLSLPFVAVGVALLTSAVNMGRRHATIATADDLVMVIRHSIFGKSTREWSVGQIEEIRCGNSGIEVNNTPVKELQILPTSDKKFGCLSQLDDAEIVWIAAELNQALGLQRLTGHGKFRPAVVNRDESGLATPTQNSRITVERVIGGIRIDVPPRGVFRYAGIVIFGLIFAAIGVGIAIGVGWDALHHGFRKADVSQLMIAFVFLLSFGGMGSVGVLIGLIAGRRRFRITAEHNALTLLRRGPFFRKTFRWHRYDLESVDVTGSGTQVNNRTIYHVLIQSRKGTSVGIMTGHDRADLTMVAAVVNEFLGLTENDPAAA